jgi:hypothetical protein
MTPRSPASPSPAFEAFARAALDFATVLPSTSRRRSRHALEETRLRPIDTVNPPEGRMRHQKEGRLEYREGLRHQAPGADLGPHVRHHVGRPSPGGRSCGGAQF